MKLDFLDDRMVDTKRIIYTYMLGVMGAMSAIHEQNIMDAAGVLMSREIC